MGVDVARIEVKVEENFLVMLPTIASISNITRIQRSNPPKAKILLNRSLMKRNPKACLRLSKASLSTPPRSPTCLSQLKMLLKANPLKPNLWRIQTTFLVRNLRTRVRKM